MRTSIVIASYNEGASLLRTVWSCIETTAELDCEIIVADDASDDGSLDELRRRFPGVHIAGHGRRQGVAPTKDLGARHARGDVLVFLDGHCNPEHGAVARLVADVEQLRSAAIVAPRVAALDSQRWRNSETRCGNGYALELDTFEEHGVLLPDLRRRGRFFESPNIMGCCFAVGRELYQTLGGFDRELRGWGVEQVDFGLKAWLLGYRVVNDVEAVIGHRFRASEENDVPEPQVVANKLRVARKHFTDLVWNDWLPRFEARHPTWVWKDAWGIFLAGRRSLERERDRLMVQRVRDEFWYAGEFDMHWPLCLLRPPSFRQWLKARIGRSHHRLADANLTGFARRPDGAWATLLLKIGRRLWGDLDVEKATFRCRGSEAVAACADLLVRIIEGRTLEYVLRLKADDLSRRFAAQGSGSSAATLVMAALRDALTRVCGSPPRLAAGNPRMGVFIEHSGREPIALQG